FRSGRSARLAWLDVGLVEGLQHLVLIGDCYRSRFGDVPRPFDRFMHLLQHHQVWLRRGGEPLLESGNQRVEESLLVKPWTNSAEWRCPDTTELPFSIDEDHGDISRFVAGCI